MATIQNVSAAGAGNQVVGKVVILYGTVKAISADGTVRLLAPNSPIFANDQIITESDGRVSIMFDGNQQSQMDLGRMSNVVIDEDVYAGPTSTPATDVTADIEEIQKALIAGDTPIELEAPAAGGAGSAGGGHPVFVINPTGAEVTPTSGAETIGVAFGAVNTVEGAFNQPVETPANNPPDAVNDVAANNDALVTPEDTPLTIAAATLTANDSDPDGDAFSITGFTQTEHGSLVQNPDGSFTYTPNENYNGPDSFTYTITDAKGATDTATVAIDVTPVNDAPDAINDLAAANDALVTPEDTPLTIAAATLTANDSDPDGDAFSITGFTQTEHGSLVQNPDGSFTYTPDKDYNGPDSFTYTITDEHGATDTATVTIDVTPVGEPPVPVNHPPVDDNESHTLYEDGEMLSVTDNALTNASDVDHDTLTITTGAGTVVGTYGTLEFNATTGEYTYTLNNGSDAVQGLAAGEEVHDIFNYTVSDGHGGTDESSINITVIGTNDPPVDGNEPPVDDNESHTLYEDGEILSVTDNALTNASDVDHDTLTITTGAGTVVGTYGTLELNATTGEYTYTLNNGSDAVQGLAAGEEVHDIFNYTVSDGHGGTDESSINITVIGTNEQPVDTAASVDESAMASGTAPDSPAETAAGSLLLQSGWHPVASSGSTTYGDYVINADGTFEYTVTNAPVNTPTASGDSITDVISYSITNEFGTQTGNTLTITIYDDGPIATDSNGVILNLAGQSLEHVIDYNLGADGIGSVDLSYNGDALTSHGEVITFSQVDINNDGLKELVGTAEVDPDHAGAETIITLAPTSGASSEGSYALTLSDVIDQPHTTTTFTVGDIKAGSPTSHLDVSDGLGGDLIIRATPLDGVDHNNNGLEVNASAGRLGIENNAMDSGDIQESIKIEFGKYVDSTFTPSDLNDVVLNAENIGPKGDQIIWQAFKDDIDVSASLTDAQRTLTMNSDGEFTTPIHVDGGFDTLTITTVSGSFKIEGFSFNEEGAGQDVSMQFGYTATDLDGDHVGGNFDVTLSSTETTALSSVNIDTLLHPDHDVSS